MKHVSKNDKKGYYPPVQSSYTLYQAKNRIRKNKYPKGNDRSPESQQVQSLDKVVVVCLPYMGMVAILVM